MRCGFEEGEVWAGIVIGVFGGSEGSDAEEAFGGCIEEKLRSPAGPVEAECLGWKPGRHPPFYIIDQSERMENVAYTPNGRLIALTATEGDAGQNNPWKVKSDQKRVSPEISAVL